MTNENQFQQGNAAGPAAQGQPTKPPSAIKRLAILLTSEPELLDNALRGLLKAAAGGDVEAMKLLLQMCNPNAFKPEK